MIVKLDHLPRDRGEQKNIWNHHLVSTSMIQIWWGPKRMIPKVVYPMKNERYPKGQDHELHSKRLCQHVWWCCYREIKIQFYPWWAKWKLPRRSWVCELVNCVSIAFGIVLVYIQCIYIYIWVTCLPFNHSEFKSSFFGGGSHIAWSCCQRDRHVEKSKLGVH